MIIGIDGNEANIDSRVGVNQYAFDLLCYIYKELEKSSRHKIIVYLKNPPKRDFPRENNNWVYKIIPGRGLWIITKLMPRLYFDNERPQVFFTPSHYIPPFAPVPCVCSIMDLGYLEFSAQFRKYDFWQLKIWSAWSIMISKKIIAISESTKQDIVRHYPIAGDKVVVTHLGYNKDKYNIQLKINDVRRILVKYNIKKGYKKYVLFLGTLKPSKNVEGLLDAWVNLVSNNKNYTLVIAGKKGWLYNSIFVKIEKLGLKDNVVFTDYILEEEKPFLISGAKVFVLPSFWEGFGLDTVAAMACGVPVVVSNLGSLPEVVGKAGILVDPYSTESIANGINKVLSMNKVEYNKIVRSGLVQARNFSWEKTASQTLKILENTI